MDLINFLVNNEPSLFAVILMLIYTLFKLSHSKPIETIIGIIIIITAITLQFKASNIKMWEKFELQNKLSYFENTLQENNISSSYYDEYIKKDKIIKKILSNSN